MISIVEISIEEFVVNIYDKYIRLFPSEEQREWKKITNTYDKGIEHFYKITLNNVGIGFIMLEKINDEMPYYLDYFAIYEEYQNQGYGTKAIKYLLDTIVSKNGLIGEIEKTDDAKIETTRRLNFYKKLGFEKVDSEYLLYDVYYTPIIYLNDKNINKQTIDKIFFDYYLINIGQDDLNKNCRIIK